MDVTREGVDPRLKSNLLRRPVLYFSYKGSSDRPTPSAYAQSELTTRRLQRPKKSIKNQFQAGSSHASSSQAQNPQTPEGESSQTQSFLGQSSRAKNPWKNLKQLIKKNLERELL